MANSTPVTERLPAPPYVAWKSFTSFIEHLKRTVVPPKIDNSMMPPTMSGGTRSHLKSALKFLDLIDPADNVTTKLRNLIVAYGTEGWREAMGDVISEAYSRIVTDLDLDSATARQLTDQFRSLGHVEGEMVERCIRFYLAALKSCGLTYSPHFEARGTKTMLGRGKRPTKAKTESEDDDGRESESGDEISRVAGDLRKFTLAIPGKPDAVIVVPHDISEKEWTMIDLTLRAYVSLNSPSEEE